MLGGVRSLAQDTSVSSTENGAEGVEDGSLLCEACETCYSMNHILSVGTLWDLVTFTFCNVVSGGCLAASSHMPPVTYGFWSVFGDPMGCDLLGVIMVTFMRYDLLCYPLRHSLLGVNMMISMRLTN